MLGQDEGAVPADTGHEGHISGVHMENNRQVVHDLDAVHDLHAGAEVGFGVLLDVVEGVLDIISGQGLAVGPLQAVLQVPGDGQGVVGDIPGLSGIGHGALGGVQLGQAVEHAHCSVVQIVIGCNAGVKAHGITAVTDNQSVHGGGGSCRSGAFAAGCCGSIGSSRSLSAAVSAAGCQCGQAQSHNQDEGQELLHFHWFSSFFIDSMLTHCYLTGCICRRRRSSPYCTRHSGHCPDPQARDTFGSIPPWPYSSGEQNSSRGRG